MGLMDTKISPTDLACDLTNVISYNLNRHVNTKLAKSTHLYILSEDL